MSKPGNGAAAPMPAAKPRIQILVSSKQRDILSDAAKRVGSDLSTWVLAHAIRAASAQDTEASPLILSGPVADRVRALAIEQDTSPDRVVEQLLLSRGEQR